MAREELPLPKKQQHLILITTPAVYFLPHFPCEELELGPGEGPRPGSPGQKWQQNLNPSWSNANARALLTVKGYDLSR